MKTVIFTRTGFHHTCFINRLQQDFEISLIVREAYPERPKSHGLLGSLKGMLSKDNRMRVKDESFLKDFHERFSAGFRYHPILKDFLKAPFDVVIGRPGTKYLNVRCGEINSPGFAAMLKELRPDIVLVLGSSVIRPHIISIPTCAMINLHSGLSPYYRGTWSYGWPIVNNEPGHIGATVHHVAHGIDTGDIIFQTRPGLGDKDDLNTIFLKVISEGIELMTMAMAGLLKNGTIKAHEQPKGIGRQYRSGDLNAGTARICLANLAAGVISDYNRSKKVYEQGPVMYGYVPPRFFA